MRRGAIPLGDTLILGLTLGLTLGLVACGVEAGDLAGAGARPVKRMEEAAKLEDPVRAKGFNPQPEPPGRGPLDSVEAKGLNPQPEPPGHPPPAQ